MSGKKRDNNKEKIDSKDFHKFWNYIEKKAFSPSNIGEIKNWLYCFLIFFNKIFEKGDTFPPKINGKNKIHLEIVFELLDVTCISEILVDLSKFSFDIKWKDTGLQSGYDSRYTCEFDYLDEHCGDMSPDFGEAELKKVLESKIHHPALHYHIKGKIFNKKQGEVIDFPHEIRIGLATKNPFLFLYQVSYQFLYVFGDEKKEHELQRLAAVIFENKEIKIEISPGVLFGI
jgi:hypothetical protein